MERAELKIRGIVQGVGFRPYIHKLARSCALSGYIKNSSSGVEIELEGERQALENFIERLPREAPALAVIDDIQVEFSAELKGFEGFEIRGSRLEQFADTLISPDIATCPDCLRELNDPRDRRYHYPFINCTNCGPRFTIVKSLPYDRVRTSMAPFKMCPDCQREYTDIEDRRYHAQPDCCPDCGPRLFYLDAEGRELPGPALELARTALKEGKIVAVKGLGGMHLACRCDDESLVKELRRRKQRDEKPFALMCRDVQSVRELCLLSPEEQRILESPRRPIVLLKKRASGMEYVSENAYLGVMLPYTPLHHLLLGEDMNALVMTSANLSDTPIMDKNQEAVEKLRGIADGFLLHDREIQSRCDDSLCWVLDDREYPVRRSRGYAPQPISTGSPVRNILACGAEQKASFCLSKGSYIFPSQHIGDLKNIETYENYTGQIEHYKSIFDIEPEAVACDMHPDYLSSAYASDLGLPLIRVQHHHAHMAACMADNGLEGEVIGLVWDGVGYGTDAESWGGECLIGGYGGFRRFGSIRSIRLIGGDRAVKDTERLAYALLRDAGCQLSGFGRAEEYEAMLASGLNCPRSSGMGRLFDGVAAILDIKRQCSYEGQGAVLLEASASHSEESYPYELVGSPLCFDWRAMVRAIVADMSAGIHRGRIAARFMNTLMHMALAQCEAAREDSGLERVCLSGGSFQNMYIMERLPKMLEAEGFQVYHHSRVSTNDEGIALGQLMIANEYLMEKERDVPCGSTET